MHYQILNQDQLALLPYLKLFSKSFYLVGGTAISLYLGYRSSIDYDLFSYSKLNKKTIKERVNSLKFPIEYIFEESDQIHYVINNVKVTFFNYPYKIEHKKRIKYYITMPTLLDLGAMKAYALGHRAKWKDYVDLYMIIKDHYTIEQISQKANEIFGEMFAEKMFRTQLSYFEDIDYSEEIDYLIPEIPKDTIKIFLQEKATEIY